MPCEQQRGALDLLTHERGVARMHSGTQRLGQERIAVVPDREQTRRAGRRIDGGSVADDDARLGREHAQVGRIAGGTCLTCVVADDRRAGHTSVQRGEDLVPVTVVGHDDHR